MVSPQGIFTYAGIAADGPCFYALVGRRQPGLINASFILGAQIPEYGDVTISYNGQTVTLPDCHLKRQTISTSRAGRWRKCIIEDRRWRWMFANLYGEYNTYEKGVKVLESRKSLADLAQMCLNAIGETASTAALPDTYPTVNFNGNKAITELEKLLDAVGFEIMFGFGRDIRIVKKGQGNQVNLYDPRIMENSVSYEPVVIPRLTIVESIDTWFQEDIPLEAVGYELNSTEPVPIDDLSYKPSGGWGNIDIETFADITNQDIRELCKRTIYKTFQIKGPWKVKKPAGVVLPEGSEDDWFTIDEGEEWRVLPLNSSQLSLYPADVDPENKKRTKNAEIVGYFFSEKWGHANNTVQADYDEEETIFEEGSQVDPKMIMEKGFTVDVAHGIVTTGKPTYWLYRGGSDEYPQRRDLPKLWLRTSFPLRNPDTRSTLRQQYKHLDNNGIPGLQELLQPAQLVYEVGRTAETEADEFTTEAKHYLEQELAKRVQYPSYFLPYKGLCLDFQIDGLWRAVTFNKSAKGECTTIVEWNVDVPTGRNTYKQKRDEDEGRSAVKQFLKEAERLKRAGQSMQRKIQ